MALNTYNKTLHKYLTTKTTFIDRTNKDNFLNKSVFNLESFNEKYSNEEKTTFVFEVKTKEKESVMYIVKYAISNTTIDNDSNNNEGLIYDYIKKLIENNICPFLYYAFEFNKFENLQSDELEFYLPPRIKPQTNVYMNILKTNTLEYKTIFFQDFFNERVFNIDNFLIILFQIMYTLKCFEIIGLKHNDLHFKNIILEECIDTNPNCSRYYNSYNSYIVNDKIYNIPIIKYTAKIFDFNLAEKFNVVNETLKGMYKNIPDFKKINYKAKYVNGTYLNNTQRFTYDILKVIFGIVINTSSMRPNITKTIKKLINSFFSNDDENNGDIDVYEIMNNIYRDIYKGIKNVDVDKNGNFMNPDFYNIIDIDNILDLIYANIKSRHDETKYTINECYNSNKLNEDISSKKVESCKTKPSELNVARKSTLSATATPFKLSATATPFNFTPKVSGGGSIFKIKHSKKTKKYKKFKKTKKSKFKKTKFKKVKINT